jgi:lysophospholipase L1-like esterase
MNDQTEQRPEPRPPHLTFSSLSRGAKLTLALLVLLAPIVLLALVEAGLRVFGAETELVPNDNVEIAIPAWLIADDNFASGLQPGVKAANVAWLRSFTEARYIWTRIKPNVQVDALNPYNEIELAKGVTFHFSSNSDGFRGREFTPKRPGVIRVVCVGDSSTFGWGVDDEYTYPRLLEARLTKLMGLEVEVFNLGIPGFTSRHGLGVLRHYALPLDADFFVFSFGANDPRQVLRPVDEVLAEDEGWRGTLRYTALRFKTFQLLRKITFALNDPTTRYDERPTLVSSVTDEQYMRNLTTMVRLARQHNAQSVLMSVCSAQDQVDAMRRVAQANRVPMVDARARLMARFDDLKAHRLYPDEVRYYENLYGLAAMEAKWQLYITSDGCHPNRAGMSVIADGLAEAIGGASTTTR